MTNYYRAIDRHATDPEGDAAHIREHQGTMTLQWPNGDRISGPGANIFINRMIDDPDTKITEVADDDSPLKDLCETAQP